MGEYRLKTRRWKKILVSEYLGHTWWRKRTRKTFGKKKFFVFRNESLVSTYILTVVVLNMIRPDKFENVRCILVKKNRMTVIESGTHGLVILLFVTVKLETLENSIWRYLCIVNIMLFCILNLVHVSHAVFINYLTILESQIYLNK